MRTVTTTKNLYSFDELSEEAQQKAIENLSDINVMEVEYWSEGVIEDAKNIGISIIEFDIDRGSYCRGVFNLSHLETANKIIKEHGEMCETYKLAESFLKERDELIDTWPKDEDGEFENEGDLDEAIDELESEFQDSIFEEYLSMLRKDYEYYTSEESVKETIECNGYEFTEDGELA